MNFVKSMYHGRRVDDDGMDICLDRLPFTKEMQDESLGAVGR
jgi:hypothetical protein